MRIVIEVDGDKVTALGADGAPSRDMQPVPGSPPAALLERAKKLGAMSAGAARIGTGAALAATAPAGKTPKLPAPRRRKQVAKKRGRRSR